MHRFGMKSKKGRRRPVEAKVLMIKAFSFQTEKQLMDKYAVVKDPRAVELRKLIDKEMKEERPSLSFRIKRVTKDGTNAGAFLNEPVALLLQNMVIPPPPEIRVTIDVLEEADEQGTSGDQDPANANPNCISVAVGGLTIDNSGNDGLGGNAPQAATKEPEEAGDESKGCVTGLPRLPGFRGLREGNATDATASDEAGYDSEEKDEEKKSSGEREPIHTDTRNNILGDGAHAHVTGDDVLGGIVAKAVREKANDESKKDTTLHFDVWKPLEEELNRRGLGGLLPPYPVEARDEPTIISNLTPITHTTHQNNEDSETNILGARLTWLDNNIFDKHGRVLEPDERARLLEKKGLCQQCGVVQTHTVKMRGLKRLSLTVDNVVLKGRCLRCNPVARGEILKNDRKKQSRFSASVRSAGGPRRATEDDGSRYLAQDEGGDFLYRPGPRRASPPAVHGRRLEQRRQRERAESDPRMKESAREQRAAARAPRGRGELDSSSDDAAGSLSSGSNVGNDDAPARGNSDPITPGTDASENGDPAGNEQGGGENANDGAPDEAARIEELRVLLEMPDAPIEELRAILQENDRAALWSRAELDSSSDDAAGSLSSGSNVGNDDDPARGNSDPITPGTDASENEDPAGNEQGGGENANDGAPDEAARIEDLRVIFGMHDAPIEELRAILQEDNRAGLRSRGELEAMCATSEMVRPDDEEYDCFEVDPNADLHEFEQRALQENASRPASRRISSTTLKINAWHEKYTWRKAIRVAERTPEMDWLASFYRCDPRWQIMKFFDEAARDGGDATANENLGLDMRTNLFNKASVFTVWRPTHDEAIKNMMLGIATGKGLDIKGKSAKKGNILSYVPFVQIYEDAHKKHARKFIKDGKVVRVFYETDEARYEALEMITDIKDFMLFAAQDAMRVLSDNYADPEEQEMAKEHLMWDDVSLSVNFVNTCVDSGTPVFGLDITERLFWEAYVIMQYCERPPGTEWDIGRKSVPAFMDLNFKSLRREPDPGAPRVVVYQMCSDCPMDPRTLLLAYEENGCVKPVVSDFDCFLLGSRGVKYENPIPKDQIELVKWSVKNMGEVLDERAKNQSEEEWTDIWFKVLKKAALKGFYPKTLPFGNGDPKSYEIVKCAVSRLQSTGCVRHGAECFNWFFPQDIGEDFLVISDTLPGNLKWKKVKVPELQEILIQKIEEGFTFPINPKWVLCDPGWRRVYDKLLASEKPNVQDSINCWLPPGTGLREKIDAISTRHPNGFGDSAVRVKSEFRKDRLLMEEELERYVKIQMAWRKLRLVLYWIRFVMEKRRELADKESGGTLASANTLKNEAGAEQEGPDLRMVADSKHNADNNIEQLDKNRLVNKEVLIDSLDSLTLRSMIEKKMEQEDTPCLSSDGKLVIKAVTIDETDGFDLLDLPLSLWLNPTDLMRFPKVAFSIY